MQPKKLSKRGNKLVFVKCLIHSVHKQTPLRLTKLTFQLFFLCKKNSFQGGTLFSFLLAQKKYLEPKNRERKIGVEVKNTWNKYTIKVDNHNHVFLFSKTLCACMQSYPASSRSKVHTITM